MLAKQYRLRKQSELDRVFQKGKVFNNSFLSLRRGDNNLIVNRFAFLVGAKVFKKASLRNKVKRRMRQIIREILPLMKRGYDVIFIVKNPGFIGKKHIEVKLMVQNLAKAAGLIL